MASPLLSELRFGSYLVYSPRGMSEVSRKSRQLRDAVKAGHVPTLRNIVEHLALSFESTGVPCPRSSLLVEGALWPGRKDREAA